MNKLHTCNKCGHVINRPLAKEAILCHQLDNTRPCGLCLGIYKRESNDTKQIRFFFHAIANYVKIKRILNND